MSNTLVINSSKYAIYVRVLAGQGDGTLVTVDAALRLYGAAEADAVRAAFQARGIL